MVAFVVGLVVGFAVAVLAVRGRARLGPSVERLLGSGRTGLSDDGSEARHQDLMQDLRASDPELADAIEGDPAVEVSTVPETLTAADQRAIETASPAVAEQVAARFIRNPDLRRVVVQLAHWRTRKNNSEEVYENSFRRHARSHGYRDTLSKKERIKWRVGDGGERIAIPDLILDDTVLVELKAGLSKSGEMDRALGQMLRYLLAWKKRGPAVLAICGATTPETRWLVLSHVNTWRKQLNFPVMAFFKQGADGAVDPEMPVGDPRQEPGD
jgi:hypothetical protein